MLAKFPKLRNALSAVQATVGNTKFAIFENILRTLPESILKHLELHPEMAERFAQRALADPDFLAAARRGDLDELKNLDENGIANLNKRTKEQFEELARDPDHGGKINEKSMRER